MVRVKICGLTSLSDALLACDAGADAVGFVFYAPSTRHIAIDNAAKIAKALPPFVQKVALFVNPAIEHVKQVIDQVEIDLLQFHGDEIAQFCEQFNKPYIKAFAMREGFDVSAAIALHSHAKGFLLDAYHATKPGGTGEQFDWQRFPKNQQKPLILAGGLHPDNVALAIQQCQPYAVDVSGGVECSAGVKSAEKLRRFIQQAKSVAR